MFASRAASSPRTGEGESSHVLSSVEAPPLPPLADELPPVAGNGVVPPLALVPPVAPAPVLTEPPDPLGGEPASPPALECVDTDRPPHASNETATSEPNRETNIIAPIDRSIDYHR